MSYGNKVPRHGDGVAILYIAFHSESVSFIANMVVRPAGEARGDGMSNTKDLTLPTDYRYHFLPYDIFVKLNQRSLGRIYDNLA